MQEPTAPHLPSQQKHALRWPRLLVLLAATILWMVLLTAGCQCQTGIVNEKAQGDAGSGNQVNTNPDGGNGNNGNPDGNNGNNGNPDGNNGNNGNPDGNNGNNGNPDGNNGNNGNPDGNNGNNGNPDGNNGNNGSPDDINNGNGNQWPPNGEPNDNNGGCGGARVKDVPINECDSGKQFCIQKQYTCVPKVDLKDGRFVIDSTPTELRGVVYNPIPKCKPFNHDFTAEPAIRQRDFPLLQSNFGRGTVLRLVRPVSSRAFLDQAYENGLRLIVGFYVNWQQDFAQTCGQLQKQWRAQLNFYQHHPSIVAYTVGEQVALYIINSSIDRKEQRLQAWYQCLNQLAGEVKQVEGAAARPVATVSAAHPKERLGDASIGADEATLNNLDFHMFRVFLGTQLTSWLRGEQRLKFKKPAMIGSFGIDACNYQAGSKSCIEDQASQARGMVTLAREVIRAFDAPLSIRLAGGIAAAYSDELWPGEPESDLCGQNASGYPHAEFPDGTYNLEWFGLADIHSSPGQAKPRQAMTDLASLWSQSAPWSTGAKQITITSHKNGDTIPRQLLVSGKLINFQRQGNEEWAALFLLVRPYQSADHYPMLPVTLCCGAGPTDWVMSVVVGRAQDVGKKFEIVPAYTTSQETYEKMLTTPYFITRPPGLTILTQQSVLVTRQ